MQQTLVRRPEYPALISTAGAVTATLAAVAVGWVVVIHQMQGMDMGVATDLGSLQFFVAAWVTMMAAMMLPGALPAIARRARSGKAVLAVPQFAVSYLAAWAAVGLVAYALYRPHGTTIAGTLTVAAGLYEFTALKRACRLRCRASAASGSRFGVHCIGSSIGLMLVLLLVDPMSVGWMGVVAGVVLGQKLLPPTPLLDVPLGLAIVGLGIAIVATPSSIPGLA